MITLKINTMFKGMLPFVSFTNTLAIKFTKELDKNKSFIKLKKGKPS